MENLVPFRKGEDSRRQVGRKKGSLNMKTVMKTLLNEQATPDYIFSSGARERFRGMGDKTLLEAIALTLVNQSLCGNTQASNIILRELRKIEEKEPSSEFSRGIQDLIITVVNSREELEQLTAEREQLERSYNKYHIDC